MSTRLVAWRDEGIWTWASLYILTHKADYLTCKTTRNNHVKAAFYKNLYQAYMDKGNFTDGRTSRSLRDLVSDRGKLCRYINELGDMRAKHMDLSWVSKRLIHNLDELLQLMPNPKQRTVASPSKVNRLMRIKLQSKLHGQIEPLPVVDNKICLPELPANRSPHITPHPPSILPPSLNAPPPSPQPDQWLTVHGNFIRPLSYQMLVSIPDGMVVKASFDSRKALGYDMFGMHFNSTLVVCDDPKDTPNVLEMVQSVVNLHNMWIKSGATKIPIIYRRKIQDDSRTYIWVEAYGRIVRWDINRTIVCIMERNVTDAVSWGRNPERAEVKMAQDIHFNISSAANEKKHPIQFYPACSGPQCSGNMNHEVPPPIMPHLLPPPLIDAPCQLPPMPPLKPEEPDEVTAPIRKVEEKLTPKVPNSDIDRFTFADPPSFCTGSFGEWVANRATGWDSSSISPTGEQTIFTSPQAEGRFASSFYSSPLVESSSSSSDSDARSSPTEGRISPIQLTPPPAESRVRFKFSLTDTRPRKRQRIQKSVDVTGFL